jgi:hypothetical protein
VRLIFVYAVLSDEVFLTKRRVVLEAKEVWDINVEFRAAQITKAAPLGESILDVFSLRYTL